MTSQRPAALWTDRLVQYHPDLTRPFSYEARERARQHMKREAAKIQVEADQARAHLAQSMERRKIGEVLREKDAEIAELKETLTKMTNDWETNTGRKTVLALTEKWDELEASVRYWKAMAQKEVDEHVKALERVKQLELRLQDEVRRNEWLKAELEVEKTKNLVVAMKGAVEADAAPNARRTVSSGPRSAIPGPKDA